MATERFSLFLGEKDRFGELMGVWSFPSTTSQQQALLIEHAESRSSSQHALSENGDFYVVKIGANEWYYCLRRPVRRLEQDIDALECCLSLITTCSYNRVKYEAVLNLLLDLYMNSGNPTKMVDAVMNFQAKGSFQNVNLKSYTFNPRDGSVGSLLETCLDYGMDVVVMYNAVLLKKRVLVVGDDQRQVMTLLETLPLFAMHRVMEYDQCLRPTVLNNATHLEDLAQAGYWIAGVSESTYANINTTELKPDVTVNVGEKRISVAPHALNAMKLCGHHRVLSTELAHLAEQEGASNAELISLVDEKNMEVLQKIRSVGGADGSGGGVTEAALRSESIGKESMQNFCVRLAVAEGLL